MRAITIIKKLRYRYAQKYKHNINENLLHYSNWLQDEYAELVMKQANEADTGNDKCHIQNVSVSDSDIENHANNYDCDGNRDDLAQAYSAGARWMRSMLNNHSR